MTRHHSCRVSPFGHPRIHARLTTPRGISQPPTSFIGSQCQGIHHAPLHTYNTKPKMSHPHTPTGACRISKLHINTHRNPPPPRAVTTMRARCSQPLSTNQTPHPTTKDGATTSPIPGFPHSGRRDSGLVVSKPNSVSDDFAAPVFPHQQPTFVVAPEPHPLQVRPISRIAQVTEPPQECGRANRSRGAP